MDTVYITKILKGNTMLLPRCNYRSHTSKCVNEIIITKSERLEKDDKKENDLVRSSKVILGL